MEAAEAPVGRLSPLDPPLLMLEAEAPMVGNVRGCYTTLFNCGGQCANKMM